MTITATILSGNSESVIAEAIGSTRDWVDGILLIDTGITDRTWEMAAESAGAKLKVVEFPWRDDFSAARNFSLKQAAVAGATWALTVDTDERLSFPGFASPEELRAALDSDPRLLAWLVPSRDGSYSKERFIRVPSRLEWRGRTHEALVGAAEGERRTLQGVEFFELPKTAEQYQGKLLRDLPVLEAETRDQPDNDRWWYYLGQTLEDLKRPAEAAEAYRRCYELRGRWPEQAAWACFRGATCRMKTDDFQDALEICTLGLARQPQSPELAWLAAMCCYRLGRSADAADWIGAKHPLLLLCAEELHEAWGEDTKFIWTYRPLADSIASLERRAWWHGREAALQHRLWEAANRFFPGRSHLRIDFDRLRQDPAEEVDRLIEYLGLNATARQRANAIAFIRRTE